MPKKSKKQKWFKPIRGSYIPNSLEGWLTYIPFTAYLLASFYYGWHDIDDKLKSVFFIVPNWIAAVVVMTWIAKRTS